MRVKAAVARTYGQPLEIETLDLVDPAPDEIVVRLVATGVGRVDRDALAGLVPMPLPCVLGSEGAGIVEHVGREVTDLAVGDNVFIDYGFCDVCESCRKGQTRNCIAFAGVNFAGRRADRAPFKKARDAVNGYFLGQSSFATHLVCRAVSAIRLPKETPLEVAAALGGDVLVAAAAIIDVFRVRASTTLAVTGAGLAGLVACLLARECGAQTIVIADPEEARRRLGSEFGATVAVHSDDDLGTAVRSLDADGADFGFDTTGRSTALDACRESLKRSGALAYARPSWTENDATVSDAICVDRRVVARSILPELVELYADGRLPIDQLIRFFPLSRVNEALGALNEPRCVKPILRFPLGAFDDLDRATFGGGVDEARQDEPVASEDDKELKERVKS